MYEVVGDVFALLQQQAPYPDAPLPQPSGSSSSAASHWASSSLFSQPASWSPSSGPSSSASYLSSLFGGATSSLGSSSSHSTGSTSSPFPGAAAPASSSASSSYTFSPHPHQGEQAPASAGPAAAGFTMFQRGPLASTLRALREALLRAGASLSQPPLRAFSQMWQALGLGPLPFLPPSITGPRPADAAQLYRWLGATNAIANAIMLSGLRSISIRPGSTAWNEPRFAQMHEILEAEFGAW